MSGTFELINVGAAPNDGSGDPLRVAFEKVNNNFTSLFNTNYATLQSITIGNAPGQLIFTIEKTQFTQGSFQINSSDQNSNNSQNITITAAINNGKTDIKWTGHSTTFFGNAVTRYSMDVAGGNVNLYADPIANVQLTHWIAYQVTDDPQIPGMYITLNQNTNDLLSTENLQVITTEN